MQAFTATSSSVIAGKWRGNPRASA